MAAGRTPSFGALPLCLNAPSKDWQSVQGKVHPSAKKFLKFVLGEGLFPQIGRGNKAVLFIFFMLFICIKNI